MVQTALRRFILLGLFSIPLLAFVVSFNLYFPFVTGKGFLMRVIIECMAAAGLILLWGNPNARPSRGPIFSSFAFFLAVLFIANLFGVNPYHSFWGNYERMEGWVAYFHFFLFFVLAITVLTKEKLWERFFLWSIACSAVMGILAILQLFGMMTIYQPYDRLDGTLGHASYLAGYMLIHFILTVFMVSRTENRYLKGVGFVIIALQLTTLYYSGTRGAQLGLLGTFFIVPLLNLKTQRKLSLTVLCTLLFSMGGFLLIKDTKFITSSPVLSRLAQIQPKDKTSRSRLMVWDSAWKGFKERPLLGWGQENFQDIFDKYYNPNMYDQEHWFDRSHNTFLDCLTQAGIMGLIAYLLLYALMVKSFWQSHLSQFEKSLFIALLGGLFIHQIFLFEDLMGHIYFFLLLAYSHFLVKKEERAVQEQYRPIFSVSIVSCALLYCSIYFINFLPYNACKNLIGAISSGCVNPQMSLAFYQKALEIDTFGKNEILTELMKTAGAVGRNGKVDQNVRQNFVQLAQNRAHATVVDGKADLKFMLMSGLFLKETGQYPLALQFFQVAAERSPNKQITLNELALTHVSLKEFDKGLSFAKRSYELTPEYDMGRLTYGMAAIYAGKIDLAKGLFKEWYGSDQPPVAKYGECYYQNGHYGESIAIFKKLNELEPGHFQRYLQLAQAEFANKQFGDAIADLRTAIRVNPSFAVEGKKWIGECIEKMKTQ